MPALHIVVPCYNEAKRFNAAEFRAFATHSPDVSFLLVNDGSTDDTLGILEALARDCPQQFEVHDLPRNRGKAEAVRQGLLQILPAKPPFVGFWDADLSTPLDAVPDLLAIFDEQPHIDIVMAARVQLLGREIARRPARHYAGRVFATLASMLLKLAVYDTQCGAKLFRTNHSFAESLTEPFETDWVFDVELLRRLAIARKRAGQTPLEEATCEFPLRRWTDVAGSKLKATDFPVALLDLAKIYLRYRDQR